MKKWYTATITTTKMVTQEVTLDVEANSEQDAMYKAMGEVAHGDGSQGTSCCYDSDFQTTITVEG